MFAVPCVAPCAEAVTVTLELVAVVVAPHPTAVNAPRRIGRASSQTASRARRLAPEGNNNSPGSTNANIQRPPDLRSRALLATVLIVIATLAGRLVTSEGENAQLAPAGRPEQANVTGEATAAEPLA